MLELSFVFWLAWFFMQRLFKFLSFLLLICYTFFSSVTTSTSSVIFSCLAVMFRFFVLKYCLDILRSLGLGEVLHLLKFLTIKYFPFHSLLSPWVSKKVFLNSWVLCFHHKLQVCMILIARYSNLLPLFSAVLILFMSHPKAFFITIFPF